MQSGDEFIRSYESEPMEKRGWQLSNSPGLSDGLHDSPAPQWLNVCDSFIDPLIEELKSWLSQFPSDDAAEHELVDHLEEFTCIVGAIASEWGHSTLVDDWRRSEVWIRTNVPGNLCANFVDEARLVFRVADDTKMKIEDGDALNATLLANQLRIIHLPRYLNYLKNVSQELRLLLEGKAAANAQSTGDSYHGLPDLAVDTNLLQARYMDKVHNLTDSQAVGLAAIVDAKGDYVSWWKLGISKPSETRKGLPEVLQKLIEAAPGKGYRLRRL